MSNSRNNNRHYSEPAIWEAAANKIGGTFILGNWLTSNKIEYTYHSVSYDHKWKIVLDKYSSNDENSITYHRVQTVFLSKDGLECRLYPNRLLSSILKTIGFQDIEIGDQRFDQKFMIKGNDIEKIKILFHSKPIRDCLVTESDFLLSIEDHISLYKPKNKSRIYFQTSHRLLTTARIVKIFKLYCLLLDRLAGLGSAKGFMGKMN
ncbi:MAG: hypothetical protein ACPGTP_01855 [Bacteroidia bacterium]